MTTLTVRIHNLDQLRSNFRKAPAITLRHLSRATKASIFEVEKQAIDKNFRFKLPRSARTGYLAQSFGFGRHISPSGLRATIGPTAHYAPYVHEGTSRGISPNPFMERIADAAEPAVNDHFGKATELIVRDLGTV